jgi:hypothetical protein
MPNLSTKPILEFSTAADPPPHPLFLSPKSSARFSRNEINKSIPSIDPNSSERERGKKEATRKPIKFSCRDESFTSPTLENPRRLSAIKFSLKQTPKKPEKKTLNHHTQISIYPSVEQKESEDDVGDDDDDNVFLPESSDVSEQKIRNQFLQPQRGKLNKKKKKKNTKPVLHCLLTKSIAQQKRKWRTDDGEEWKLTQHCREESRKRK